MSKYHVNPMSGNPGVCRATHTCPFGGDDEHYNTREDARAAFEAGIVGPAFATHTSSSSAPTADALWTKAELEAGIGPNNVDQQEFDKRFAIAMHETVQKDSKLATAAAKESALRGILKSVGMSPSAAPQWRPVRRNSF